MDIELTSYTSFAVICLAAVILFSIKRKIKAVISLGILLFFLIYKIYGINQAYALLEKYVPDIPLKSTISQEYEEEGSSIGDNDVKPETDGKIGFKLPKIELPTLKYYDKGK